MIKKWLRKILQKKRTGSIYMKIWKVYDLYRMKEISILNGFKEKFTLINMIGQ